MEKWILAFDAGCGRCRDLSSMIEDLSEQTIVVRPLADPDIRGWREAALGSPAPWAPTLIAVEADQVRAWVGMRMKFRLARRLGLRSTVRLLVGMGEARNAEPVGENSAPDKKVFSRKSFLAGVGGAIAAIALTPGTVAAQTNRSASARWVELNTGTLRRTHESLISLPPEHQKAFYLRFTPAQCRQFWLDNLDSHRRTTTSAVTTSGQDEAARRLSDFLRTTRIFEDGVSEADHRELAELERLVKASYSPEAARTILTANLMTELEPAVLRLNCECSPRSDYCWGSYCRDNSGCNHVPRDGVAAGPLTGGCGTLLAYRCTGMCQY
jgi:hypothetical protein